jgi:hypothetical protein
MSVQNQFITILTLILGSIVGYMAFFRKKKDTFAMVENFMDFPLDYKVDRVYEDPKAGFVSVPGTYQSPVPPRFGMLDGAIVDNRQGEERHSYLEPFDVDKDMAYNPAAPLQQGIMDVNGEMIVPVVYDRLIYANKRSRTLQNADFIRGDLPIRPINLGWFSPSAIPHIDLRRGIIDQYDMETADQLRILQMKTRGDYDSAYQGSMVLPNTNTLSYGSFINPPVGDVQVVDYV